MDGRYADTTTQPDIQLALNLRGQSYPFAVECKWRSQPKDDFVRFANEGQLERYTAFGRKENCPVFIVLGIGGKPSDPAELYILPVQELDKSVLHKARLGKYRRKWIPISFLTRSRKRSGEAFLTAKMNPLPEIYQTAIGLDLRSIHRKMRG